MQYLPVPEVLPHPQMAQMPQMAQIPQMPQMPPRMPQMPQMPQMTLMSQTPLMSRSPQLAQMLHVPQSPQMLRTSPMPQMLQTSQMLQMPQQVPVHLAQVSLPNFSPSPHMIPSLQFECFNGNNTNMPIEFELTPTPNATCTLAALPALPALLEPQRQQRSRKRRLRPCSGVKSEAGGSEEMFRMLEPPPPRKSRSSCGSSSVCEEDNENEDARSVKSSSDKRQNHSEIEKRRRDKMNNYISELAAMVPACRALARKLDKLTVLRMAVQHLRAVCEAIHAGPLSVRPLPSLMSESELNALVLTAGAESFVTVLGCERGRIMYLSASVTDMLSFKKSDLLGQSFFDLLHPKDVAKVQEQMCYNNSNRDHLPDATTMLPALGEMQAGVSRLSPGSRRSFFCRIRCQSRLDPTAMFHLDDSVKDDPDLPPARKRFDKKYCLVQCTGFLKWWAPPATMSESAGPESEAGSASAPCLVCVVRAAPDVLPRRDGTARAPPPPGPVAQPRHVRAAEFISRHSPDGKFVFVDQRVTLILGYLPHELVGTSVYQYVESEQASALAEAHRASLQDKAAVVDSMPYAFRRKDGALVTLLTSYKHFTNPCSKELEFLVANNTVMSPLRYATPPPMDVELRQPEMDCPDALLESSTDAGTGASAACGRAGPSAACGRVGAGASAAGGRVGAGARVSASSGASAAAGRASANASVRARAGAAGTRAGYSAGIKTKASSDASTASVKVVVDVADCASAELTAGNNIELSILQMCLEATVQLRVEANVDPCAELRALTIAEPRALTIAEPRALTIAEPRSLAIVEPRSLTIVEQRALAIVDPRALAIVDPRALKIVNLSNEVSLAASDDVDANSYADADIDMEADAETTAALSHLTEAVGDEVKRMLGARSAALGTALLLRHSAPHRSLVESLLNCDISTPPVRNNVSLSEAGSNNTPPPEDTPTRIRASQTPPSVSPPLTPISFNEDGEATMDVLINMLDSEDGYRGPVNFAWMPQ